MPSRRARRELVRELDLRPGPDLLAQCGPLSDHTVSYGPRPVLGRVYTGADFQAAWMPFLLTHHAHTFDIPVEVVVRQGRWVAPKTGRAFPTDYDLVMIGGRAVVLHHDALRDAARRSGRGWYGIAQGDSVTLYEVWENQGDDGHTVYQHRGWIFVAESVYKAVEAELAASDIGRDPPDTLAVIEALAARAE